MFDLLQHASDDQMALALCFGALVMCGAVMHFSLPLARLSRRSGSTVSTDDKMVVTVAASPETSRREKAA